MLDLILLGTGGGMPMPDRFLSCLLINYKGRKILVDCGEGTQVSMKMAKCGFKSIDVICITHTHGDHIFGLPGLLSTMGNSGRTGKVKIIGPPGIKRAVLGLNTVNEYLPFEIEIIEDPKEDIKIFDDKMIISVSKAEHSSPCLGYSFYLKRNAKFDVEKAMKLNVPKFLWNRLQNGEDDITYEGCIYQKSMVMGNPRKGIKLSYITDSRPIKSMTDFISHSDLFICEGTYGDDLDIDKAVKNKHMTFREAAELARDGNVKKLILTHFSTALTDPLVYSCNASDVFENTIIGQDRMKISLDYKG